MQRQIIKGSVFYLYSGEGASLNYIGEKTYPGRKQVITKKWDEGAQNWIPGSYVRDFPSLRPGA